MRCRLPVTSLVQWYGCAQAKFRFTGPMLLVAVWSENFARQYLVGGNSWSDVIYE